MTEKLKHLEGMAELCRQRMVAAFLGDDYESYEKWRAWAVRYLMAAREIREMGYSN